MLDAIPATTVDTPPQDVGHAVASAPTPSGCRGRRWFVVAAKPRAERRAHAALHLKGYQPYLPTRIIRRNKAWATVPLFDGYLFVNLDPAKPWYPIRYAPGVFCLLTIDGIPTPCPEGAVEALQASDAERQLPYRPEAAWRPGAAVAVANGPFAGHPAVILSVGQEMALVSLLMFGQLREVAVSLDALTARD